MPQRIEKGKDQGMALFPVRNLVVRQQESAKFTIQAWRESDESRVRHDACSWKGYGWQPRLAEPREKLSKQR
jgi:hypothetical protein